MVSQALISFQLRKPTHTLVHTSRPTILAFLFSTLPASNMSAEIQSKLLVPDADIDSLQKGLEVSWRCAVSRHRGVHGTLEEWL